MKTELIKIDPDNIDLEKIRRAARVIKKGGLVAFPTETVYGLAADFLNQQAVDRISKVKKRPQDKPFTVQIEDVGRLENLVSDIPVFAYQLISKFWPGPLTLVFPARQGQRWAGGPARPVKRWAGGKAKQDGTIGVRIPRNKIAQNLIKESQTPLVVPSANLAGEPAARTAPEVLQTFAGLIEMIIDGGRAELGIASTVVDLSVSPYRILREGAISQRDIQSAQG